MTMNEHGNVIGYCGGLLGWWLADKFGWNPFGWVVPFPHDGVSYMIMFSTLYLLSGLATIAYRLGTRKAAP